MVQGTEWIDVRAILREMKQWTGKETPWPTRLHPLRREMAFVSLLMGNDYFPTITSRWKEVTPNPCHCSWQ